MASGCATCSRASFSQSLCSGATTASASAASRVLIAVFSCVELRLLVGRGQLAAPATALPVRPSSPCSGTVLKKAKNW